MGGKILLSRSQNEIKDWKDSGTKAVENEIVMLLKFKFKILINN